MSGPTVHGHNCDHHKDVLCPSCSPSITQPVCGCGATAWHFDRPCDDNVVLDTDGYLADAVQREEDRQQDKAEQVAEGRLRRFIGAYFVTCCLVTLGCALLGVDTYLLDGLVLGGTP